MGKRTANPREGDKEIIERHGAGAMAAEKRDRDAPKDKKSGDKTETRIPKKQLEFPDEPNKPDDAKFEEEKKKLEEDLEKLNSEFKAATDAINEKQSDKDEYNAQRQLLRDDLDKAQKTVDELFTEYNGIVSKIKEAKEINRKAHMEYRDMSKDVEALGEEGIEKKIKQLQLEMELKPMTLKQTKEQMKLIQSLEKQKPKVQEKTRKLEDLERQKNESADQKKPLQDQAENVGEILRKAKEEKKEKAAVLRALREKREKETEGVREFIDKKKEVRAKIDEKRDAIKNLRWEHKQVKDAHYDWKRACQKIKNDAWKAEEDLRWEIWRAEEKKEKLQDAGSRPHFEETTLIEQTLDYCKGLIGEKKAKEEEKKEDIDFSAFGFPEGARVCVPKKDRDVNEGAVMAPKGKKLRQKNKQGGDKAGLNHNAGTFALFKQTGVDAPLTLAEVPDAISALNKKMETYTKKIKEWEAKRDAMAKEVAETEAKTKEAIAAAEK